VLPNCCCVCICAAATTLDYQESPDFMESTASKQEIDLNMHVPQFSALNETISTSDESTAPYVAPLPRVRSPVRSPRKTLDDSTPPGPKSKKKGALPRVATLVQPSPKTKVEPKKSPPPFRAGGKVGTGWNREAPGQAARKSTPTRATSAGLRETSKVSGSSLVSRSSTTEAVILPRRTSSPRAGSRRTIVKPPDSITRAIKESRELSKRDSLDSNDDADMQNLREILNDIKTIKSELGVESSKADQNAPGEDNEEVVESALRPQSPIAHKPDVEEVEPTQSEEVTVSYMTDGPAGPPGEEEESKPNPDDEAEAESPSADDDEEEEEAKEETKTLQEPETKTDREIDQEETKQSSSTSPEVTKESSSCLCCSIM
jgi:hypothetical protein